jgi:hypothetical protein
VQILSSALPGFRSLRPPLTAGYLWLLFGWAVIKPDVTTRPGAAIERSLWDLAQEVGPVGVALATGVAAYLLGSLSQDVTLLAARPLVWLATRFDLYPTAVSPACVLIDEHMRVVDERADTIRDRDARRELKRLIDRESESARFHADRELDLPGLLLMDKDPDAFAHVDRVRAEAEFRLAVAAPLVACFIYLTFARHLVWFLGVPAAIAILVQGLQRREDSRGQVAEWLHRNDDSSAALRRYQRWLETDLHRHMEDALAKPATEQGS